MYVYHKDLIGLATYVESRESGQLIATVSESRSSRVTGIWIRAIEKLKLIDEFPMAVAFPKLTVNIHPVFKTGWDSASWELIIFLGK